MEHLSENIAFVLRMRGNKQIVEYEKLVNDLYVLERPHYTRLYDVVNLIFLKNYFFVLVVPVINQSAGRLVKLSYTVENRCFARAVGTYKTEHFAFFDVEGQIVYRFQA